MTSIARPPQPLPNSRMRWPGLTRAFCKTWWILRSWAASRSPEVGPSSRSPRRPPSASDQSAQEYIISLLRKAWKRWGPSKVLMKHENNYLKQFIWLVITGDGVEPRLRASLAKETVVKARNSRRYLCDRRWEGLLHSWLIVEPKLQRKRNQSHNSTSSIGPTFMAPLRDDTSTSPIIYASLTANMKLRLDESAMWREAGTYSPSLLICI